MEETLVVFKDKIIFVKDFFQIIDALCGSTKLQNPPLMLGHNSFSTEPEFTPIRRAILRSFAAKTIRSGFNPPRVPGLILTLSHPGQSPGGEFIIKMNIRDQGDRKFF